jgi:hypothetical protein
LESCRPPGPADSRCAGANCRHTIGGAIRVREAGNPTVKPPPDRRMDVIGPGRSKPMKGPQWAGRHVCARSRKGPTVPRRGTSGRDQSREHPMRGVLAAGLAVSLGAAAVGTAVLASAASLLGVGTGAPAASSAATTQIPSAMLTLYEQAAPPVRGFLGRSWLPLAQSSRTTVSRTRPACTAGPIPPGPKAPCSFCHRTS